MSQVSIVRNNAILPFTAGQDLTGLEGHAVILFDGEIMTMDDPELYTPVGVLLKGGKKGESVSVAVASGGFSGTVRVKLGTNAEAGGLLQADTADGLFAPADSASHRWTCAQALEDGFAGEKIEAVLFKPEFRSS